MALVGRSAAERIFVRPPQRLQDAMFFRRLLSLGWSCVAIGCMRAHPLAAAQADVYAVYAAALDSFAAAPRAPMPLESTTRAYTLGRRFGDTSALYRGVQADTGISASLFDGYERANVASDTLCECFPARLKVELKPGISTPDLDGPVLVSNVGFDSDRRRALVWVGRSCGPLCGSDALFLVVKRDTTWVATRRVLTGAS